MSLSHRAENTDDKHRLQSILSALAELAKEHEVIFPMHPRTKKIMEDQGLEKSAGSARIVEPVAFIDMVRLEQNAKMILTDSGGIQKEAYFHGVPCVTLRDETEWVETVTAGWNQVVGTDALRIIYGAHHASCGTPIADYGTGNASAKIVDLLAKI